MLINDHWELINVTLTILQKTRLKNAIITDAVRNRANFLFQRDLKHTNKALDWLLDRTKLKLDPNSDHD